MIIIIIKSDFHGNAEILSSHFPKRSLALFRKFAAVAQLYSSSYGQQAEEKRQIGKVEKR